MGTGIKHQNGRYASIWENFPAARVLFDFDEETGYFGRKGKSARDEIRNICSDNPLETARRFHDIISSGGIERRLPNGKGLYSEMKDHSFVSFRPVSSSDGSPAVDITISSQTQEMGYKAYQKIHFIKEVSNERNQYMLHPSNE